MRTIVFRGKTLGSNAWCFGDLRQYKDNDCSPEIIKNGYRFRVKSETVGQFTGLYDKNDKEIYEGDVLKVYYHGKSKIFGVVRFADTRFFIDDGFQGEEPIIAKVPMAEMFSHYDFEVVGNAYDNPELIR